MWRLIRAEWNYEAFVKMAYGTLLGFMFFAAARLEMSGYMIPIFLPQFLAIATMIMLISRCGLEKRTRLHAVLPVSIRQQAIARLIFQGNYWLIALLLYIFSQLPLHTSYPVIWRVLVFNATFIASNAAYIITYDMLCSVPNRSRVPTILWLFAVWFVIIVILMSYFEPSQVVNSSRVQLLMPAAWLYHSWYGMILLHIGALGLSIWSWVLFVRRQAYLC